MLTNFSVAGDDQLLRMPYGAAQGSGSKNVGYIDLKLQPERIGEIHELKGYPELEELIRLLNKPDCIFRTLRTDTVKDFFNHPNFSKSCFSHLTISFDNPDPIDDRRFYQEFYDTFVQYKSSFSLSDAIVANFVLIPFEVKTYNFKGWCLDIWMYGFGDSEDETRFNWSVGLLVLKDYLVMMDERNR